jgi:hypothetical protein
VLPEALPATFPNAANALRSFAPTSPSIAPLTADGQRLSSETVIAFAGEIRIRRFIDDCPRTQARRLHALKVPLSEEDDGAKTFISTARDTRSAGLRATAMC